MANIVAVGLIGSKVSTQFIQPFIGTGTTSTSTSSTTTSSTTTCAPGVGDVCATGWGTQNGTYTDNGICYNGRATYTGGSVPYKIWWDSGNSWWAIGVALGGTNDTGPSGSTPVGSWTNGGVIASGACSVTTTSTTTSTTSTAAPTTSSTTTTAAPTTSSTTTTSTTSSSTSSTSSTSTSTSTTTSTTTI